MVLRIPPSLWSLHHGGLSGDHLYPILGLLVVVASTALLKQYLRPASLPLPPGPKPLPVIGNVTQIPQNAPLQKFQEWIATYGPMVSFKVGSRTVILLGDRATARALLDKRFSLYGDRPRMIFINEYLFKNLFTGAMPHNEKFRTIAKLRAPIFSATGVRATSRLLPTSTAYCLHDMLSGGDLLEHLLMVFTRAIFPLLYGKTVDSIGPTHMRDVKALLHLVGETVSPDGSIVDLFPALEYIPGVSWWLRRKATGLLRPIISKSVARMEEAIHNPSWNVVQAIYAKWPSSLTLEEFSISMMELEVTPGAMTLTMTSILKMTLRFPDALRELHDEMDRVIGIDRLPTLDDIPNLPYYNAFIREALRLGSLTPLGLPRAPTRDDEYLGFRIPKDAVVFPFFYGMNMDEAVFENPHKFDPSRWIRDPSLTKPVVFGFGKRACPGQAFTTDTIALTIARILWGYNCFVPDEVQVKPFLENLTFHIDSTAHIKFVCKSEAHRAVIEKAYQEADVDPTPMLNDLRELF